MKISVIYHSEGGNTQRIAEIIAEGARVNETIDIKTMHIDSVDMEFVNDSKAVIFGCPTYCGTFSWQMKKWFDTNRRMNLKGKLGSVFATVNHIGGGAEIAELGMIGHLLLHGMLVYSAGHSQGSPFTHYGAVTIKDGDDFQKGRANIFGKRIAEKAIELFCK